MKWSIKRAKNHPKRPSKIEGGKSDKRAKSSRYFLFNGLEKLLLLLPVSVVFGRHSGGAKGQLISKANFEVFI